MPKMRLNLVYALDRVAELEKENAKFRGELLEMLLDRYLQVETLLDHHRWGGPDKDQLQRLHDAFLRRIAELEEKTSG